MGEKGESKSDRIRRIENRINRISPINHLIL
jgi:hypothetical protein